MWRTEIGKRASVSPSCRVDPVAVDARTGCPALVFAIRRGRVDVVAAVAACPASSPTGLWQDEAGRTAVYTAVQTRQLSSEGGCRAARARLVARPCCCISGTLRSRIPAVVEAVLAVGNAPEALLRDAPAGPKYDAAVAAAAELRKAMVNCAATNGYTPLHIAAFNGEGPVMRHADSTH